MQQAVQPQDEEPVSVYLPKNILITRNARAEAERRFLEYDSLARFASLWCACLTTVLSMLSLFSNQEWLTFVSAASAVIMTITIFYASSRNYSEQATRMRLCYTELQGLSIEASRLLSTGGDDLEDNMAELGKRYVEVLKRSDNHSTKDYKRAKKDTRRKADKRNSHNADSSPSWGTVLGDDKLATAAVDRIVHHGRLVEFGGNSRRFDEALMMGKSEK